MASGVIPKSMKRRRLHDGPETSKRYVDEYFESWNSSQGVCFPLPFSVDYNKPNRQSERCLYDYFCELQEASLVINGYHRNTEGKAVADSGKIEDVDLLLGHRDFGLFLFEAKDMREVVKFANEQDLNQNLKDMGVQKQQKKNDLRCPIYMIDYAVKQLNIRWPQVKDYLQDFFRDTEIKKEWAGYWKMEDESCIDEMLEEIGNQEVNRSIICLFGWSQYDENGNAKFDCHQNNCDCQNKEPLIIATCHVITSKELKDFESFKTWWQNYLKQNFFADTMENKKLEEKLPAFEFLLNRIGVDFYRSDYIRKSVDIFVADENIRSETNRVKVELHTSMPEKLTIRDLDSKLTPAEQSLIENQRIHMRQERELIADSLGIKNEEHNKCMQNIPEAEKSNTKNVPEENEEIVKNESKEKKRKRKKKKEKSQETKTKPMSNFECEQVAILWDRMQKRILLEAQLALINGPPGSGKTILIIERVRKLVNDGIKKVLIIAGNNEGLATMLRNELDQVKEYVFVKTDLGFIQWCAEQNDDNVKRFQHIFIDEAHDLPLERVVHILQNNMVSENVENRHFWILRDSCQNKRWTAIRSLALRSFQHSRDGSTWKEEYNLFTAYSLKFIFRLTQRQFRLIQPLTEYIYCDKCSKATLENVLFNAGGSKKIVCDCQPWHGIVAPGPEPLKLYWLTKDSPWPDNTAELVLKAFVLSWSNNLTLKKLTNEQFYDKLKTMFRDGLFGKTTILTEYPEKLTDDLNKYINNIESKYQLDEFGIVRAKEFYEQSAARRKFCLTVETWQNFQGLESSVVIMFNPFQQWQNNEGTTVDEGYGNEFLISLSRANCRSILITLKDDKNFVERVLKIRAEFSINQAKCFIPMGSGKTIFELLNELGKTIHYVQPTTQGDVAQFIQNRIDLNQLFRLAEVFATNLV